MQTEILRIASIDGAAHVERLTRALDAIDGVDDFNISPAAGSISVRYDERRVTSKQLQSALQQAGYAAAGQSAHANGGCCGSCGGE